MRWSLLVGLLSSLALAAPAPKKPASALSDGKDEAPSKPAPQTNGPDLALLRGLMYVFEPAPLEIRVLAIEDMGLLGDARALNPLANLSLDPTPQVAKAAVRAIGSIRHPRAEEILRNIVLHPSVPEATKIAAMELIPFQNTPSALRFVRTIAGANTFPGGVLGAARKVITDLPPAPPSVP